MSLKFGGIYQNFPIQQLITCGMLYNMPKVIQDLRTIPEYSYTALNDLWNVSECYTFMWNQKFNKLITWKLLINVPLSYNYSQKKGC